MWELFVQAGPLVNVYLPKDRVTSQHQGYGFVEFKSEEDADYVRHHPHLPHPATAAPMPHVWAASFAGAGPAEDARLQ